MLIRVWGNQRQITDERVVHVLKNLELLSPAQRTILHTTVEGRTLKEIAAATGLAVSTVETHRKRLLKKFGLHSIQELLFIAGQLHLNRMNSGYLLSEKKFVKNRGCQKFLTPTFVIFDTR